MKASLRTLPGFSCEPDSRIVPSKKGGRSVWIDRPTRNDAITQTLAIPLFRGSRDYMQKAGTTLKALEAPSELGPPVGPTPPK